MTSIIDQTGAPDRQSSRKDYRSIPYNFPPGSFQSITIKIHQIRTFISLRVWNHNSTIPRTWNQRNAENHWTVHYVITQGGQGVQPLDLPRDNSSWMMYLSLVCKGCKVSSSMTSTYTADWKLQHAFRLCPHEPRGLRLWFQNSGRWVWYQQMDTWMVCFGQSRVPDSALFKTYLHFTISAVKNRWVRVKRWTYCGNHVFFLWKLYTVFCCCWFFFCCCCWNWMGALWSWAIKLGQQKQKTTKATKTKKEK